jgi:hypothetical protein
MRLFIRFARWSFGSGFDNRIRCAAVRGAVLHCRAFRVGIAFDSSLGGAGGVCIERCPGFVVSNPELGANPGPASADDRSARA